MIYIKPPEWNPPPEPEPEKEEGSGATGNLSGAQMTQFGQHIGQGMIGGSSPLYVPPPASAIGSEPTQPPPAGGGGLIGGMLGPSPTDIVEIIPPAPTELPVKPSLKTDRVEIREGSNAILDNLASAPKLDPSELSSVGQEFPAVQIKPYAFYEPSPIPKTVENRASAADFKENEIRKQLDEALKSKRNP